MQALAFQIGSQISYNEIGQLCVLDKQTVERYIALLEKAFIVFRLPSFSRHLRNELKKSRKSILRQRHPQCCDKDIQHNRMRQDAGALWENYCISEE